MTFKREYWEKKGYVAVHRKSGKFKNWMFWSDYLKLKMRRKMIKNKVVGLLQKYPKRLAMSYATDWVMVTFGIPPVFSPAVQVFIETIRH